MESEPLSNMVALSNVLGASGMAFSSLGNLRFRPQIRMDIDFSST
jgi:hypothetical protein